MRILCIDDDRTFLTMFKKVLEKHALPDDDILLTQNPREGIELAKNKSVDLVLTDLIMPQISGLDVLREVKEQNEDIEVIVITGQGSIDSAVEAMQLGARDYLTKPLNHGMLIEKIQNIREFLARLHEAEDYRYAKEIIESRANQTVTEMEIKLNEYLKLVDSISEAIHGDATESEKISAIAEYISGIENAD